MKPLRVVLGLAAAGALVAALLVVQSMSTGEPARDRLAVSPVVVAPSVLLDVQGAVIEELPSDCARSRYPSFCQRVQDELRSYPHRAGLTIRTTLDQRMQQAAQRAIDGLVTPADSHVAAEVMVVPGSGEIRAMAASHGRGDRHGYQQGTTAMVYTLAAAFEAGMRVEDGFPYVETYVAPSAEAFKTCKGASVGSKEWVVHNVKRGDSAFVTLESGTRGAVNTFFVALEAKVGLCETVRMAQRLGVSRTDGVPLVEVETFTLGVNEVDAVTVAGSYATLAARGRYCAPRAVTEVRETSGTVRTFPAACKQVVDEAVADAVTSVLAARSEVKDVGRDAAGMPGTTDGYTAAWYAGYTPALAAAVSLSGSFKHDLTDVTIGGRHYDRVYGTTIPGPIWVASMAQALEGTPATPFSAVDTGRFGGCRQACE